MDLNVQYLGKLIEDSYIPKSVLARKIDVPRGSFYERINGRVDFKADEFIKLMGLLGVDSVEEFKKVLNID